MIGLIPVHDAPLFERYSDAQLLLMFRYTGERLHELPKASFPRMTVYYERREDDLADEMNRRGLVRQWLMPEKG
jgi:hypothetical protein